MLYLGVFGTSVYAAFVVGQGDDSAGTAVDVAGAVISIACDAILALVAGLAIIRGLTGTWRPVTGAGVTTWRREVVAGSACTSLAFVSFLLMPLLPSHGYPTATTGGGELVDAVGFLQAGPVEEVCALLAPLIILRAARLPWPAVFALLVALRLSYHLYYGPGAVFLTLWALGTVVVYLWARSIIGIAIAHSLFDLSALPAELGHPGIGALLRLAYVLFCIVVSIATFARARRRATRRRANAFPVPVVPPPPVD